MAQWAWYAMAAMVFVSLSNIVFKLFVKENPFDAKALWPFALIFVASMLAVVGYSFFVLKASLTWILYLVGLTLFSGVGFVLIFQALKGGKVALVTAILSLSTVLVALISYLFLGDRFELKDVLAVGLAVASLYIFVL